MSWLASESSHGPGMPFVESSTMMTRLLVIALLALNSAVYAQDNKDKTSKLTPAEQMHRESHLESVTNAVFGAAWVTNKYGTLNNWDEKIQTRVARALDGGVDINARDVHGRTALMHAVIAPNSGLFIYLLNRGARLDIKDNNGFDVEAIRQVVNNTIGVFQDLGRRVRYAHKGQDILLFMVDAVASGNKRALELWFSQGVSVDYFDGRLVYEAIDSKNISMLEFLVANKAKLTVGMLRHALTKKQVPMANFLVSQGLSPSAVEDFFYAGKLSPYLPVYHDAAMEFYFFGNPEYLDFLKKINLFGVDPEALAVTRKLLADLFDRPDRKAEDLKRQAVLEHLWETGISVCRGI